MTPADIQRVARRYLTDNRSAAIRYMPAEMAKPAPKGDTIAVAETVEVAELKTPGDVEVDQARERRRSRRRRPIRPSRWSRRSPRR